ncbi:uncharacterized protein B0H18DRAFT_958858 [Fomitopsis serialis]|uniref:uncharacterized protein n=1 Tax=Fomitopsis serialis TaxID=139415 RepID=UPI0020081DED|nr:uncharacterized protein B0H18DRAFT_958858 [Neoantrodia serialis]KAH9916452.1 hypothetical protein B0H18DRAFT_958858 [Neoantrodia serialis]
MHGAGSRFLGSRGGEVFQTVMVRVDIHSGVECWQSSTNHYTLGRMYHSSNEDMRRKWMVDEECQRGSHMFWASFADSSLLWLDKPATTPTAFSKDSTYSVGRRCSTRTPNGPSNFSCSLALHPGSCAAPRDTTRLYARSWKSGLPTRVFTDTPRALRRTLSFPLNSTDPVKLAAIEWLVDRGAHSAGALIVVINPAHASSRHTPRIRPREVRRRTHGTGRVVAMQIPTLSWQGRGLSRGNQCLCVPECGYPTASRPQVCCDIDDVQVDIAAGPLADSLSECHRLTGHYNYLGPDGILAMMADAICRAQSQVLPRSLPATVSVVYSLLAKNERVETRLLTPTGVQAEILSFAGRRAADDFKRKVRAHRRSACNLGTAAWSIQAREMRRTALAESTEDTDQALPILNLVSIATGIARPVSPRMLFASALGTKHGFNPRPGVYAVRLTGLSHTLSVRFLHYRLEQRRLMILRADLVRSVVRSVFPADPSIDDEWAGISLDHTLSRPEGTSRRPVRTLGDDDAAA